MSISKGILFNGVLAGALAVTLLAGCKTGSSKKSAGTKAALKAREAYDIATEAYIYGYPLVTVDLARKVMTNVREPEGIHAPLGWFAHMRTFPTASNHEISAPNADMLASLVWLDVTKEPWVVSMPDMHERYSQFSLLDAWTTVFESLGKRTTGTGPQKFVITGPRWKGKLPSGLKRYKAPTGIVALLGRIYCTGTTEDYAAVHAIQDACSAVPLSSYGKPYTPQPGQVDPTIDMETSVREQVNNMDAGKFFNQLALLMKDNPPAHDDAKIIKRMARLHIVPGKPFDINGLNAPAIEALQSVPKNAHDRIMGWFRDGTRVGDATFQDGWVVTRKTGVYGADYIQRALVAAISRGASLPQDTFYAISTVDSEGQPYAGNYRYVMHFAAGQAPSAHGFWSLSMYDAEHFFVENALGRYTLNARDPLKFNTDGSLDFYIQKFPPGSDRETNWLPMPDGKFILVLRVYWPKDAVLSGSWKLPPVKRIH
jgi:hypothetical protein